MQTEKSAFIMEYVSYNKYGQRIQKFAVGWSLTSRIQFEDNHPGYKLLISTFIYPTFLLISSLKDAFVKPKYVKSKSGFHLLAGLNIFYLKGLIWKNRKISKASRFMANVEL